MFGLPPDQNMRRREFITLIGGAAATWPLIARAQPRKIPRVGYLMNWSGPTSFDESFEFGLREMGYIVGQNIAIEYRWTEGKSELLASLARELVALSVDVIVTGGETLSGRPRKRPQVFLS
jgi:putative ABC transport system substrate-binding protein